jgi:hypothetical protein
MNGNQGVQPVVELAGANNAYPVYPVMGGYGNSGFGGFGGDGAIWIILIIALLGGFNNGNGGFGNGFDNGYAWLSNGQKDIMNNTTDGFNSLHLSNQVEGIRSDVNDIQNAICNSTASVTSAINNGFYNSEIAAANRQMANMNTAFDLSRQFADCCCENRLATCQTQNTIVSEAANTRFADANNTRDIIDANNRNSQAILDKLCQLELDGVKAQVDAKNDKIADLQRELSMADLRASQTAQNAFISQGFANEVDQLYNRLNSCPVPTTPVYGRTPIFTCNNNGCGCNGYNNLI